MTLKKQMAHATALSVGDAPRLRPLRACAGRLYPDHSSVHDWRYGDRRRIDQFRRARIVPGDELGSALLEASGGAIIVGPTTDTDDTFYMGIAGPSDFGPGEEFLADMGDGAIVGLGTFDQTSGGVVAVPLGYVSGASLGTSTATWSGATIASLGLTPGSYVWTWGSGAMADSFTLDITSGGGIPAAPEPGTWTMMLLGLAGLAFVRARRTEPSA